jgi:hypothetical protein
MTTFIKRLRPNRHHAAIEHREPVPAPRPGDYESVC